MSAGGGFVTTMNALRLAQTTPRGAGALVLVLPLVVALLHYLFRDDAE